jgi:hypothetical protein
MSGKDLSKTPVCKNALCMEPDCVAGAAGYYVMPDHADATRYYICAPHVLTTTFRSGQITGRARLWVPFMQTRQFTRNEASTRKRGPHRCRCEWTLVLRNGCQCGGV